MINAYEMINITEHFATDFQKFKTSTAEKIDEIEHLILENVIGHDSTNRSCETTTRVVIKQK